jgi:putative sugar O-methyltransferase
LQDENIKKIKFGDSVGNPVTWDYEILGNISATLIRYMNVLQDLNDNFGLVSDLSIVEIGGGYGGQCSMIKDFYEVKSYDIVDISQAINLIKKYLERMNHVDVGFISAEQIVTSEKKFDLLISNYAISELNKDTQDLYLEKLIKNSRMGYVTYNALKSNESRDKPYSDKEFKEILKSFNFDVKSYNENVKKSECEVIIWKSNA